MCCCDKPTINGTGPVKMTFEYPASDYSPMAPKLLESDVLLYDEPGRCGGMDSHAFHYTLVKGCGIELLVKHGGGEERVRVSSTKTLLDLLATLDTNQRYWIFNAIFHAHSDAKYKTLDEVSEKWRKAAAEKRIKTRKVRGESRVKVWIEHA